MMLIRFIIIFIILSSTNSFAENNYKKDIENVARSLISAKYEMTNQDLDNAKLHIKIAPLNKKHTFIPCETKLIGEIVGNRIKKNTSVKISCQDPIPWTTYVRARVQTLVPTVAASQALSKGQTLNPENIKLIYTDKSQVKNGSFSALYPLLGTRLKRNISPGRAIKDRDVCFVCKNDKVIINAIKKGLVIKASGIALNDANIGRTVKVKNARTQRVVVGTVSGLKEVHVYF